MSNFKSRVGWLLGAVLVVSLGSVTALSAPVSQKSGSPEANKQVISPDRGARGAAE